MERPVIVEKAAPTNGIGPLEKQILIEEVRETVAAASMNPIVLEQIKQVVRREVEGQFWLNYPRFCRNCGYPTISGACEPAVQPKDSIFAMLV